MPKTENIKKAIASRKQAKAAAVAPGDPMHNPASTPDNTEPCSGIATSTEQASDAEIVAYARATPGVKPVDLIRKFKVSLNHAKKAIATAAEAAPETPAEAAAIDAFVEKIGEQAVADAHALPPAEPPTIGSLVPAQEKAPAEADAAARPALTVVKGGADEEATDEQLRERFGKTPDEVIAEHREAEAVAKKVVAAAEADAATPPAGAGERMLLAVAQVHPHPKNPRIIYPRIEELAADIGEHGLREPIKVRPVEGGFEILSGHRRMRAIEKLGWTEVPAIIEPMDDLAAYQRVVVENEHREDLTAIEEGIAFQGLIDRGQTVEEIAKLVGKSVAHVYARMKLTALGEAGREAMVQGWLTAETALLVARIPTEALQEQALKEIGPDEKQDHDAMSYREAQQHIQGRYMLVLAKAPFDRKSVTLLPTAGACSECPKRSGSLPAELRADLKGADICLDRDCYGQKTEAEWSIRSAAAKECGLEVVDAKEAEHKFLVHHGDELATHNGVCDLDDVCYEDKEQRTWRQVLGKKNAPQPDVLIQSPHTGAALEGWKREKLIAAAVEAKAIKPRREDTGPTQSEKEAAERKKIREQRKVADAAIAKIMENAGLLRRAPIEVWRELADQALEHTWGTRIAKRRGYDAFRPGLESAIKKMEIPEIQDLLVETILQREVETMLAPYGGRQTGAFKKMIEAFGVDWKAAEALAQGAKDEPDEPPASAPAKKGGGAKGPLARKLKGRKK